MLVAGEQLPNQRWRLEADSANLNGFEQIAAAKLAGGANQFAGVETFEFPHRFGEFPVAPYRPCRGYGPKRAECVRLRLGAHEPRGDFHEEQAITNRRNPERLAAGPRLRAPYEIADRSAIGERCHRLVAPQRLPDRMGESVTRNRLGERFVIRD